VSRRPVFPRSAKAQGTLVAGSLGSLCLPLDFGSDRKLALDLVEAQPLLVRPLAITRDPLS
jgi:hypothetical protein